MEPPSPPSSCTLNVLCCSFKLIMQDTLEVFWLFVVEALAPTTIYPFSDEHADCR